MRALSEALRVTPLAVRSLGRVRVSERGRGAAEQDGRFQLPPEDPEATQSRRPPPSNARLTPSSAGPVTIATPETS
jgi:hypothetical protein